MYTKRLWLLVLFVALTGCLSLEGEQEAPHRSEENAEPEQTFSFEQEEERDTPRILTLINAGDFDIYSLFIRRSGTTENTGKDFLYADILFKGESIALPFPHAGPWDIILEDAERARYTISQYTLNADSSCTLTEAMLDH
ncbi:MAG: hypothetical protein LBO67_03710 [Spirochaetaceae bacterium]|jgi:hypothetical protein|nr:hypothetical protein [Spirochaetaceae bacterium]